MYIGFGERPKLTKTEDGTAIKSLKALEVEVLGLKSKLVTMRRECDKAEAERDGLRIEKRDLKEEVLDIKMERKTELEDLKLKQKISDDEIKHHIKLKEERQELEYEKKVQVIEREKMDAILKVKDEYRDKTEAQMQEQLTGMKGMYSEILERLPNVNASLDVKNLNVKREE